MLLIKCPWCGERTESEYSYGGEDGISRPHNPDELSDEQWADYLFMRKNTQGQYQELWNHSQGCRRWFGVERNTVSYKIARTYKPGEGSKSAS